MKTHVDDKPFACGFCTSTFNESDQLERHLHTHTEYRINPSTSHHCTPTSNSEDNLPVQEQIQSSQTITKPIIKCEHCDLTFCSRIQHYNHLYKKHTNVQTKAYQCNQRMAASQSESEEEAVKAKAFHCDQCEGVLADEITQKHHRQLFHEDETPFKCYRCEFSTTDAYSLKEHQRGVHGEKYITCHLCHAKFQKGELMESHLMVHGGVKPYQCHLCSYSCDLKKEFEKHMNQHTLYIRYWCHLCPKGFKAKNDFRYHLLTHEKDRYPCLLCPFTCSNGQSLKRHMETRHGDLEFACPLCPRKFAMKGRFNKHVRTHSEEKPHKCHLCSYASHYKGDLNTHLQTHKCGARHKCKKVRLQESSQKSC